MRRNWPQELQGRARRWKLAVLGCCICSNHCRWSSLCSCSFRLLGRTLWGNRPYPSLPLEMSSHNTHKKAPIPTKQTYSCELQDDDIQPAALALKKIQRRTSSGSFGRNTQRSDHQVLLLLLQQILGLWFGRDHLQHGKFCFPRSSSCTGGCWRRMDFYLFLLGTWDSDVVTEDETAAGCQNARQSHIHCGPPFIMPDWPYCHHMSSRHV